MHHVVNLASSSSALKLPRSVRMKNFVFVISGKAFDYFWLLVTTILLTQPKALGCVVASSSCSDQQLPVGYPELIVNASCINCDAITGVFNANYCLCGRNSVLSADGVCSCKDGYVETLDGTSCFLCDYLSGDGANTTSCTCGSGAKPDLWGVCTCEA